MRKLGFFVCIVGIVVILAFLSAGKNKKSILIRLKLAPSPSVTPTPTLVQSTEEILNKSKIINGTRQFVSKTYHFSFSYPYDWQLLDEPNVVGYEIQKINSIGTGISISIRINDNPQHLSVEEYAKTQAFDLPNGTKDVPQPVTVGNVQGYKLQHLPDGLLTTIYLPYRDGKILYIFAGGEYDKSPQMLNYYNQIVNNFLNSLRIE